MKTRENIYVLKWEKKTERFCGEKASESNFTLNMKFFIYKTACCVDLA